MARVKRIHKAVEQSKDGVLKMSLWRLDQKYVHCTPVMKHNFGPQMGEVDMEVGVTDWLWEQPHTSHYRATGKLWLVGYRGPWEGTVSQRGSIDACVVEGKELSPHMI